MGLFNLGSKRRKSYPASVIRSMTQTAEELNAIVTESVQLAASASDLDIKKARLEYAMKKLVELIRLANEYSFIDFRKISAIYESIREVRSEIRDLESPPREELQESSVLSEVVAEVNGSPVIQEQPVCPYCSYRFPVMPGRRQACPSCNGMIRVWYSTRQNIKRLITEEEAKQIEKEITSRIENYEMLNKQETLEKSEAEVIQVQEEMLENDPDATLDDAYIFLLDKKLSNARRYDEKSSLFYLKALILDSSGKEFFSNLRESRKWELMHLKANQHVKHVRIITGKGSCNSCKSLSDKTFSIDEAIRTMPLPHQDCIRPLQGYKGFCRCSYLVVSGPVTS